MSRTHFLYSEQRIKTLPQGFSLIELLMVIAIVGILASFLYPYYSSHIIKTGRAEARINLLRIVDAQERYYLKNNVYFHGEISTLKDKLGFDLDKGSKNFTYTITIAKDNSLDTYKATSTPKTGSAQTKDKECYKLIINHLGQKRVIRKGPGDQLGASSSSAECWSS